MLFNSLRTSIFLAKRYIQNFNKWTSTLIIFILFLTFINVVVIKGFLVGLIVGSEVGFRDGFAGDVILNTPEGETSIVNSQSAINTLESADYIAAIAPRVLTAGSVTENYKQDVEGVTAKDISKISSTIIGIDVVREELLTGISSKVIAGDTLSPGDANGALIGRNLLAEYSPFAMEGRALQKTDIGDRILVTVGGVDIEYVIRGVLRTKVEFFDNGIVVEGDGLSKLISRYGSDVNQISVLVTDGVDPNYAKAKIETVTGDNALVQTYDEAIGVFLADIKRTFELIGGVIGTISLFAALATIFIIIFITSITKRRSIGVLKGIGISSLSVQLSYLFLALFYALVGLFIGVMTLVFILKPYFDANPIDFPFSEGILFVTAQGVSTDVIIIIVLTSLAAFFPVKIITKKSALDAILDR